MTRKPEPVILIQDTDLLAINREGVDYQISALDLKMAITPENLEPDPGDPQAPDEDGCWTFVNGYPGNNRPWFNWDDINLTLNNVPDGYSAVKVLF